MSSYVEKPVSEIVEKLRAQAATTFEVQTNFLKDKILTIIDAAIHDDRQCKATKDLIHAAVLAQQRHVNSIYDDSQCADSKTIS